MSHIFKRKKPEEKKPEVKKPVEKKEEVKPVEKKEEVKPVERARTGDYVARLASIELTANKDVKKGEKVTIESLFVYDERRKEFEVSSDIKKGDTKIKIDISKVAALEIKSDATKKKGEKTNLTMLLSYSDPRKELTATGDVKKGDKLTVNIETV